MKTNDTHIEIPASKSLSNRWLVLNYLAGDTLALQKLSDADDTELLRQLLKQLRHRSGTVFYCHNAGTVARFMLAILAVTPGNWMLTGDERLCQRPIAALVESLRGVGINITYTKREGFLPVSITGGEPTRKMFFLDPSDSSQFVSALLLIGAFLPLGMTLTLTDRPPSRPYINMTCDMMQRTGINVKISPNNRVYTISPLEVKIPRKAVVIERDWSSASYFYLAAAICPGLKIRLQNLQVSSSLQGDRIVDEMFSHLGVQSKELRSPYRSDIRSIRIVGGEKPADKEVNFNFLDCPDLMPAVAVACAALKVNAKFKGISHLRLKESDRVNSIKEELERMGGKVTVTDKTMQILPSTLNPTEPVRTHADHRIAMAFGVLRLRFPQIEIKEPEVVSKSFPRFWEQLSLLEEDLRFKQQ